MFHTKIGIYRYERMWEICIEIETVHQKNQIFILIKRTTKYIKKKWHILSLPNIKLNIL